MKKLFALLCIFATLLSLASCAGDSSVPDGMKLAAGGESVGYELYVPAAWTCSSIGDVNGAYVSRIDTSNVTLTEAALPEGNVEEYFRASLAEFPTAPTVTLENEVATLGNATEARKYSYTYEYSGHTFRFLQVFATFEGRFYIFTYTAPDEPYRDGGEETFYQKHLDEAQSVMENIVFHEKTAGGGSPATSPDGMTCISDKELAGFALYVTDAFRPTVSSGIVSADAEGGNITMARATATGVMVSDYWETRKTELSAFVTDLTEIEINKEIAFGNARRAFSYEYTYHYNGETYHVFQVLGTTLFNGYVFTFTAKEAAYETLLPDVMKAIEKVEF